MLTDAGAILRASSAAFTRAAPYAAAENHNSIRHRSDRNMHPILRRGVYRALDKTKVVSKSMSDENSNFYPAAIHAQWPSDHFANDNSVPSPMQSVRLDVAIRDLLPGRVLRVTAIEVSVDALSVRYEVRPPINIHHQGSMGQEDLLKYVWYLAGCDDLGNEYDSGGGAYGVAANGEYTEGVHSLMPAPAAGASWLDIAFYNDTAGGTQHPFERARYMLRVDLPLVERHALPDDR